MKWESGLELGPAEALTSLDLNHSEVPNTMKDTCKGSRVPPRKFCRHILQGGASPGKRGPGPPAAAAAGGHPWTLQLPGGTQA